MVKAFCTVTKGFCAELYIKTFMNVTFNINLTHPVTVYFISCLLFLIGMIFHVIKDGQNTLLDYFQENQRLKKKLSESFNRSLLQSFWWNDKKYTLSYVCRMEEDVSRVNQAEVEKRMLAILEGETPETLSTANFLDKADAAGFHNPHLIPIPKEDW